MYRENRDVGVCGGGSEYSQVRSDVYRTCLR